MPGKGQEGGYFWGSGNVLFLDLHADYMGGLLCKNSFSYTLTFCMHVILQCFVNKIFIKLNKDKAAII